MVTCDFPTWDCDLMMPVHRLEILLIVLIVFDCLGLGDLLIVSGLYVSFRVCVCL